MSATLTLQCPKHKQYKARREPTGPCMRCYDIWLIVKNAKDYAPKGP
jgi:hypothetical protein